MSVVLRVRTLDQFDKSKTLEDAMGLFSLVFPLFPLLFLSTPYDYSLKFWFFPIIFVLKIFFSFSSLEKPD